MNAWAGMAVVPIHSLLRVAGRRRRAGRHAVPGPGGDRSDDGRNGRSIDPCARARSHVLARPIRQYRREPLRYPILRAAGHEPQWVRSALAAESRKKLAAVDLHFHDLRHEAGCRWLEHGWAIHHVQEMLGHANLSQTSTYLHASEIGLQESMRRFDAERGKPVANDPPIEQPPLNHNTSDETDKGTLH